MKVDRKPVVSVDIHQKTFQTHSEIKTVLSRLHFVVDRGEFVTILGPSGCGKTTLLRIIAGLDTEYEGAVLMNGEPVKGPGRERSIVFQEARLFPWMNVRRNVAFGVPSGISKTAKNDTVSAAIQLVGVAESSRAWPTQLSGGMAKRVALARAIVNLPSVLLLDEPLTALDSPVRHLLQSEIRRIHHETGMTTLLVTHDIPEAVYLSDKVLVLAANKSHILGEFSVVLEHPRNRNQPAFQDRVAALTKDILELWSRNNLESECLPLDK